MSASMARRHLDKRLQGFMDLLREQRPTQGWLRAIRDALGMSTTQMARRMQISQPRISRMEKAEARKTITLDTLERAAQALDCRLVYAIVPNQPLEKMVEVRARALAKRQSLATRHSMSLESQSLNEDDEAYQLEHMVNDLIAKTDSRLWEDV